MQPRPWKRDFLELRTLVSVCTGGFQEKRTRHGSYKIAEPEKALLDWIYLQRLEGLRVVLDELNLKVTDKSKLPKYASNYPIPVQQTLHSALFDKEQLPERRNPAEKEPRVR